MNSTNYAALVAIDWGEKHHAYALQMRGVEQVEAGQIEAGAEVFHGWLEQLQARCDGQPVALAIEAGRSAVLHVLWEYPWLEIYPVHPATSARFRQAFTPSGAKDDVPDAKVLLTLLSRHRDQLSRLLRHDPQTRELATLVQARRQAVNQRKDVGNQLRSLLKCYYPQALELVGDDWCSPLALDFLDRWPQLACLQKTRASTLRSFYTGRNVRRPELIEQRIARVAAARPLTRDQAVIEPAIRQLGLLVALLRIYHRHIVDYEQRIAEVFAAHSAADF